MLAFYEEPFWRNGLPANESITFAIDPFAYTTASARKIDSVCECSRQLVYLRLNVLPIERAADASIAPQPVLPGVPSQLCRRLTTHARSCSLPQLMCPRPAARACWPLSCGRMMPCLCWRR